MNSVRSTDLSVAVAGKFCQNQSWSGSEFRGLQIRTTREDTGNCGRRLKCGNCSTGKSGNRLESAQSARKNSPTTTTLFPTTEIQREWAERGETIIRTTFKQRTGGATEKRDQQEWND